MNLVFLMRTAIDTDSVINRTCYTCLHCKIKVVADWAGSVLQREDYCAKNVANITVANRTDCPEYVYIRKGKKL